MEERGDHEKKNRPKRKKQNSRFLRNAKVFAKQGVFGRGTRIEDDDYQYYINILDVMRKGFEDAEEKVNMANNVFEQTTDQEIHFASNQIVCKVLETLVGFVHAAHLERFFDAFADNFRPGCSDRFASHVLQKMVEIAFLRGVGKADQKTSGDEDENDNMIITPKRQKIDILNEEHYNLETEFSEEHRLKCRCFIERISKFLLNNLEDFVWDPCANHIMRTCILSLAGLHVTKVAFGKRTVDVAKKHKLYKVASEWIEIMKEYPQRLEMWPQFSDFPFNDHSSALLCVICIALKSVDKKMLKHFGKKILFDALLKVDDSAEKKDKPEIIGYDDEESTLVNEAIKTGVETIDDRATTDNSEATNANTSILPMPIVFEYKSAVIILETLLALAGRKLFTQLYATLFNGRVATLAQQPQANFAVQKLLQNIKNKDDLENIFDELSSYIEELLKIGHTGVIEALSSACLRLGTKQAHMIVALQTALHVAGDKMKLKQFFQCLIKLKPYEIACDDKSSFVHLHGSLIVQHILHYNKPIFLVTCILDTSAEQLLSVFNTPNGSHIADAFVQSKFIGEKSREKLIRHLEGLYIDLAVTKFGSHVTVNLFNAAQETQKERIVKELVSKTNMLKGSPFGQLLYHKFRIETYRLSATQWRTSLQHPQQSKEQKAAQLFKNIL